MHLFLDIQFEQVRGYYFAPEDCWLLLACTCLPVLFFPLPSRYACRIVQRLIERCPAKQTRHILHLGLCTVKTTAQSKKHRVSGTPTAALLFNFSQYRIDRSWDIQVAKTYRCEGKDCRSNLSCRGQIVHQTWQQWHFCWQQCWKAFLKLRGRLWPEMRSRFPAMPMEIMWRRLQWEWQIWVLRFRIPRMRVSTW